MFASSLTRAACFLAVALAAAASAAQPWLVEDFRAVYEAKVGLARGETQLELRRIDGGLYEVESWTKLTGILGFFKRGRIHEVSRFEFRDGRILPLWFKRSDAVSKEDRNVRVDYDWQTLSGTVTYQGKRAFITLEEDTSNTLLMQIALMQDIRAGRRRDSYSVLGHKGLLHFYVSYEDELRIDALDNSYTALRYSHERPDSGTRTTFWAVPDFGYLPAYCEIIKNNELRGKLALTSYARL